MLPLAHTGTLSYQPWHGLTHPNVLSVVHEPSQRMEELSSPSS